MDSLEPLSPFDIRPVVRDTVEWNEMPTGLFAQAKEELIEDLTPGRGVDEAAVSEDPVEIEESGADAGGQPERTRCHRHLRQPRRRPDAGCSGHAGK